MEALRIFNVLVLIKYYFNNCRLRVLYLQQLFTYNQSISNDRIFEVRIT